ncbi:FadR/GntR family transcriptional regulator [Bacillus sp. SCS-153A]|uniref:FadR/GntR family transcriptional regulator n=1 Tax=Rossellomorea sedimentorum TaxID=3115294 RepID=UPI003906AD9E
MKRARQSFADQVVNEFLEDIEKGIFSYGEQLPSQDKLAEYYEVSRIVIREALNKLSVMGIVYFHQGKGTYLRSYDEMTTLPTKLMELAFRSEKNMIPLLEARRIIEKEICILAAERRSEEDCQVLEELLEAMFNRENEIEGYAKYDLEFHLAIAKAAQNDVLHKMLHMIKDLYWNDLMTVFKIPGILENSTESHKRIYQAIKNKDGQKAAEEIQAHLRVPEEIIKKNKSKVL